MACPSIPIDHHSEGLLMAKNRRWTRKKQTKQSPRQVIRIGVLPDDVLLEIFDSYMIMNPSYDKARAEAWQSLVHVCRRWRNLVFGSPRRLNLRLFCTPKTPARDTLDVWPALPLLIKGSMTLTSGADNIVAALEQSNRVPFPELIELRLFSNGETLSVIPDSFLDGSAPRLRFFELHTIPFPGLPKLLLSAAHLVYPNPFKIPRSGYISPEVMVALLSALSSLDKFILEFQSPQSPPDWDSRSLPPPKRSIFPALNKFRFKGATEYLEELVTGIDAPQLIQMDITFFNQIDFDCPRLAQFISCTPTLKALDEADVQFDDSTASVALRYRTSRDAFGDLGIYITCREPDWQLSSVAQVCNSSLHPLSMVEDLYIGHRYWQRVWKNDAIENTLCWELLLPFTAVKNLFLRKEFAPRIAAALQELVGSRITVLPSLQNIFVEGLEPSGPFQENIGQFVAARQLSDLPIAISDWETYFDV